MGSLDSWISILGLPIASGVNLYATVLLLGLGQRFGWIESLPQAFEFLSHPAVLVVAGVLYVVEFVADKIPFVDTVWDGLHTLIRPAGAAFLALNAAADYGPRAQLLALVIGAALGLGAHSTKAGARLLVNTSPEPVSNSIISIAEDFGVAGLLVVMYTYPWAALAVVLALIGLMALAAPLLFRMLRFLLGGIGGMIASWFGPPKTALGGAPEWLAGRISSDLGPGQPRIFRCFARDARGAPRFQAGYLLVDPDGSHFAFKTLFRRKIVPLAERLTSGAAFERRILFDVILFETDRGRHVVCVGKDYSSAVEAELVYSAPNQ